MKQRGMSLNAAARVFFLITKIVKLNARPEELLILLREREGTVETRESENRTFARSVQVSVALTEEHAPEPEDPRLVSKLATLRIVAAATRIVFRIAKSRHRQRRNLDAPGDREMHLGSPDLAFEHALVNAVARISWYSRLLPEDIRAEALKTAIDRLYADAETVEDIPAIAHGVVRGMLAVAIASNQNAPPSISPWKYFLVAAGGAVIMLAATVGLITGAPLLLGDVIGPVARVAVAVTAVCAALVGGWLTVSDLRKRRP